MSTANTANRAGLLKAVRDAWTNSSARLSWQQWMIVIVAVVGASVLLYPTAASWFSTRVQAGQAESYSQVVDKLPPEEASDLLEAARAYNERLPKGPLRDPFKPDGVAQETAIGDYVAEYREKLAVPGSDIMARLRIPSIEVDLPVRHGTDPEVLAEGAGHIFGSALPVGGAGTHSVLTAHSGQVNATLFDDLHKLTIGDRFEVDVLGESLVYQIDQVITVLPNQADALESVEGKDYLTLITCTPTGINTHRLLVRGVRVLPGDEPSGTERVDTYVPPSGPGFPWWAVILICTALGSYVVARLAVPGPRESERSSQPV